MFRNYLSIIRFPWQITNSITNLWSLSSMYRRKSISSKRDLYWNKIGFSFCYRTRTLENMLARLTDAIVRILGNCWNYALVRKSRFFYTSGSAQISAQVGLLGPWIDSQDRGRVLSLKPYYLALLAIHRNAFFFFVLHNIRYSGYIYR